MSPTEQPLIRRLCELAADADKAQTHRAHTSDGFHEPVRYIRTKAARSLHVVLSQAAIPELFDSDGRLRTPSAEPAASTFRMDAALIANSLAAKAGAHVLIQGENTTAHAVGRTGDIMLERRPSRFSNIEAATFGVVDINTEADAPIVALPIYSTNIDWQSAGIRHLGVRFEIPRSARRATDPEELWAEIIASLALGLSRAADNVLLDALSAAATAPFTFGAAAAQGIRFEELAALVGSAGSGAVVGLDGVLRAGGVAAMLTADMVGTVVGAFNRCAIAVNEDVSIHAERLGRAGHLSVTCWAQMLAVVPDANKFWTVA